MLRDHDWCARSAIHNAIYVAFNLTVPGYAMDFEMTPYRVRLANFSRHRKMFGRSMFRLKAEQSA